MQWFTVLNLVITLQLRLRCELHSKSSSVFCMMRRPQTKNQYNYTIFISTEQKNKSMLVKCKLCTCLKQLLLMQTHPHRQHANTKLVCLANPNQRARAGNTSRDKQTCNVVAFFSLHTWLYSSNHCETVCEVVSSLGVTDVALCLNLNIKRTFVCVSPLWQQFVWHYVGLY